MYNNLRCSNVTFDWKMEVFGSEQIKQQDVNELYHYIA